MINVGIIGGAGYTAGELIRILLWHPLAKIKFIQSNSHAGEKITKVHRDLVGETDLVFNYPDYNEVDVIFLCSGHGKSEEFMRENPLPRYLKIIDLSTDFRHKREGNDFVYGLPELDKELIQSSEKVANPGCFATAIELALLPLAEAQKLTNEVHVNAITGSTGSGQKPTATSHFSWKNSNVAIYKPFGHQHLKEINESIKKLQENFDRAINFIPVRGNFSRGIMATAYTECDWSEREIIENYTFYYKDHPFVTIVDEIPDVKQVVNTNKCLLYPAKYGSKTMVVSIIDNLLKGASGQAVQNMNLMFGIDETTGLNLKPVAF
ncbi:MAG: N-acetyl-gamma-glutamyl-phosphate reductase [Chloroflexia bacterium]|nr:N-acetyl-gamma-glutamyl-phosphate reductase [Chloroflexia bacterium]